MISHMKIRVKMFVTKVLPFSIVNNICFNHFSENFCWNDISDFKILENFLWMFVMSCASTDDDEATTTSPSKQTTKWHKKKFKFRDGLHIPAKNFKEILKIKFDHHEILNNFCKIKFNSEECPRHHNVHTQCVTRIFRFQGQLGILLSAVLQELWDRS